MKTFLFQADKLYSLMFGGSRKDQDALRPAGLKAHYRLWRYTARRFIYPFAPDLILTLGVPLTSSPALPG